MPAADSSGSSCMQSAPFLQERLAMFSINLHHLFLCSARFTEPEATLSGPLNAVFVARKSWQYQ